MGRSTLPNDWHYHFAGGHDCRSYCYFRLPRHSTAHGPHHHTPDADLSLTAAGLGASTAFAGFYCAYHFDLPLGPAEVALASLVLAIVALTRGLSRMVQRWQAA